MQSPQAPVKLRDVLLAPLGCLMMASPAIVLALLAGLLAVSFVVYQNVNVDIFGIGRPDYAHLQVNNNFDQVINPDYNTWKITYEMAESSTFIGLVRHVSPIREPNFVILTHDILITSGDFADASKVSTSVINHRFTWVSPSIKSPQGKINLLHVVPKNEAIYKALLKIKNGDQVTIQGREILIIDAFGKKGQELGWWSDSGCNTIRVDSVTIKNKP